MENKKYNTSVKVLAKVFQSLEGMDFQDLPVFTKDNKFEDEFITTLVLSMGDKPAKLNDMFCSITGESKNFSDTDLDELCEVAQSFFDNTPRRFKDTVRTMIDGQKLRQTLAMQQMKLGMQETMEKMVGDISNVIPGITTLDQKSH